MSITTRPHHLLPALYLLIHCGFISLAWADDAAPAPTAATPTPTTAAPPESADVEEVAPPFKVSGLRVTPLPLSHNRLSFVIGLGAAKTGDETVIPMPAGVAYERRIGTRIFARAQGTVDLGALLLQTGGGYQFLEKYGLELMAGYTLWGHESRVDGRWAIDAKETTGIDPTVRKLQVTYLNMTLPARTAFVAEGGLRRNVHGLTSKVFPEAGSYTLVAGVRSVDMYRARLDALDQKADGTSYWFAHVLAGALGGTERTASSPGAKLSPIGFELGYADSFWLTSPVNLELVAGLSPALGWFGYFGMTSRLLSW